MLLLLKPNILSTQPTALTSDVRNLISLYRCVVYYAQHGGATHVFDDQYNKHALLSRLLPAKACYTGSVSSYKRVNHLFTVLRVSNRATNVLIGQEFSSVAFGFDGLNNLPPPTLSLKFFFGFYCHIRN